MTRQKSLKTRIRARMAKTGEAYTTARRHTLSRSPGETSDPAVGAPGVEERAEAAEGTRPLDETSAPAEQQPAGPRRYSDEVVRERTGKTWDEWFAVLDAWGATDRSHPEIARWLDAEFGIGGWWSQGVTVEYERARGLRDYYQQGRDYTASASKTVNVPIEKLFDAFADDAARDRWTAGRPLRVRTARPNRSIRFDADDGEGRVIADFTAKGDAKSMVAVQHERLPDRAATDAAKRWWTERLAGLKATLEGKA